jgi:hypothetical protein
VVTAVAAIKNGDEILVSYIDPCTTTLKRQKELQSRWQFTCACRLCSRPQSEIDASDSRRVEMAMATTVLIECDKKETYSTAVNVWKELDAHAVAEGITDNTLLHLWVAPESTYIETFLLTPTIACTSSWTPRVT